jgi:electron transport complex protein RnfD
VIYGVLLGLAAMLFRYYGTYDLGICFSFLIVNAISGYFDRAIARGFANRKGAVNP